LIGLGRIPDRRLSLPLGKVCSRESTRQRERTTMNSLNWFELPTHDLERAAGFYEKVLGLSLKREVFFEVPHAVFPGPERSVRGALVKSKAHEPATKGTVIYLHAADIDAALSRVKGAGGTVVTPKTSLGPIGFMAVIDDTEGNRVGLHTPA